MCGFAEDRQKIHPGMRGAEVVAPYDDRAALPQGRISSACKSCAAMKENRRGGACPSRFCAALEENT